MSRAHEIADVLRGYVYRTTSEAAVQVGLAEALSTNSIAFAREVVLTPRDRIDFLVEESIGIEVKCDGTLTDLTRQIARYLAHERVGALLVVVTRRRLAHLPDTMLGKPVVVVDLVESCL